MPSCPRCEGSTATPPRRTTSEGTVTSPAPSPAGWSSTCRRGLRRRGQGPCRRLRFCERLNMSIVSCSSLWWSKLWCSNTSSGKAWRRADDLAFVIGVFRRRHLLLVVVLGGAAAAEVDVDRDAVSPGQFLFVWVGWGGVGFRSVCASTFQINCSVRRKM